MKNGIRIKLRTHSTDLQAFVNVWVLQEYRRDGFEIDDTDTIVDVGGHIGLFTLYVSQFCKNGRIISIEPIKDNYDLLRENVELNNLTNVKVFNAAVYNEQKKTRIFLNSDDDAAHSFYGSGKSFIEVDTLTLPQIIESENISICNLLKLDCEGAEYQIIDSLSSENFSKIKKICLEYHFSDSKPNLLTRLKDKLNDHYKIDDFPSMDGMGILFALHL